LHEGFVTEWRTIHCSLMINLVKLFGIPNTFVSSFNPLKDECWKLIYIMDLHLHLLPLLRGLPRAFIVKEHCPYIQKLFCLSLHILGAKLLLVHLIWMLVNIVVSLWIYTLFGLHGYLWINIVHATSVCILLLVKFSFFSINQKA